jgi:hypothetical protein
MTKAQMRVKIARDVIKQLKKKRFRAYSGIYVSSPTIDTWYRKMNTASRARCAHSAACSLRRLTPLTTARSETLTLDRDHLVTSSVGSLANNWLVSKMPSKTTPDDTDLMCGCPVATTPPLCTMDSVRRAVQANA